VRIIAAYLASHPHLPVLELAPAPEPARLEAFAAELGGEPSREGQLGHGGRDLVGAHAHG
jgi:hypothetical protein